MTAKTLVYNIDTVGGQSGCPVYIKKGGQRYVVGIHNYGAATGNSATRITAPVYERLNVGRTCSLIIALQRRTVPPMNRDLGGTAARHEGGHRGRKRMRLCG